MGKMIFFDIDGTLIDMTKKIDKIPLEVIKALDELKRRGNDVFLATGRCKCFILDQIMDYPFDGYVTCNGACVEYKDKIIYQNTIKPQAIKETIKFCQANHLNFYFENSNTIYVRDVNDPKHLEFCNMWQMKVETCEDEFNPDDISVHIGMIVVDHIDQIPEMVETLSPYFDIQRHQSDNSFDLTMKQESKAVGIRELVYRLNRNMADTVAFGDGRNDIEMLEEVELGIAMGNGAIEAKNVADYITRDIDDHGIVLALQKYGLIGEIKE